MKRFFSGRAASVGLIVTLAGLGAVLVASLMTAVEIFSPPQYSHSLASVSSVSADAWIVFDMESGEVLLAHNEKVVVPIASLTKLKTAQAVYRSNDLWSTTTISYQDIATEGRAGRLLGGQSYTQYQLLFPLLLESSNDAAAALLRTNLALQAEVAGTSSPLVVVDAAGLSPENTASAMTLRNLLLDIYHHDRHLIDITTLRYYLTEQNGWLNNSPFIAMAGYAGGKHGYTEEAGRTAAVLFKEELRFGQERTLGYVLLGSTDLAFDIGLLRDAVKSQFYYR